MVHGLLSAALAESQECRAIGREAERNNARDRLFKSNPRGRI